MADGGTGEKTEEPTPERLRKLRKEGNVPKSQDVNGAVGFLAVFLVMAGTFGLIGDEMVSLFQTALLAIGRQETEEPGVLASRLLNAGLLSIAKATAPILAVALVVGVAANIAQVGFMFTTKPITPDLNKVNPINGLKGLVNMKKIVELLKTVLKFVIISWVAYSSLKDAIRDVVMTMRADLMTSVKIVGSIIWDFSIRIGAVFAAIAAFDAFYQHKRYIKDNMMSKYDIKQEYKQSEGDPQHKAERKRLHHEIINSAAPANVKKAKVVVRNPEHIAVALDYDTEKGGAPVVVAKGERVWAEKILEAAKHYGIPIMRNVPLAQALNKLDVGDEVPEDLYEAVAEVLNFVFQLSEKQKQKK